MNIARYLHAIGTLLIGIALFIGVFIAFGFWQTGGQARTLTVTGQANAALASDESTVSGSWQEKADTSAAARTAAEEQASAGVEAIKGLGIADNKIKTLQANVYPEYDYSSGREPKITGYVATTTVQVTLEDTNQAQAVLNLMTEKQADSTTGPQFGLSTEASAALQKELKIAAVADARSQAEALAEQAGGRVGKVLSVTGGDLSTGGPQPIPYATRGVALDAAAEIAPTSDLQPGENELVVTVYVTYQLK